MHLCLYNIHTFPLLSSHQCQYSSIRRTLCSDEPAAFPPKIFAFRPTAIRCFTRTHNYEIRQGVSLASSAAWPFLSHNLDKIRLNCINKVEHIVTKCRRKLRVIGRISAKDWWTFCETRSSRGKPRRLRLPLTRLKTSTRIDPTRRQEMSLSGRLNLA